MCHMAVIQFFTERVEVEEFSDRRILEVGSKYVNGSVRPLIEKFCHPKEYIGIDLEPGKSVDIVMPIESMVEYFGPESFDTVISTEVLEHVRSWRLAINDIKNLIKPSGYLYVTTRSEGYPYHSFPYDFWRYEVKDMKRIFGDFEIVALERDPEAPGLFLKARKPNAWEPIDLSEIDLYSMILGKRTTKTEPDHMPIRRRIDLMILPRLLGAVLGQFYKRIRPRTFLPSPA